LTSSPAREWRRRGRRPAWRDRDAVAGPCLPAGQSISGEPAGSWTPTTAGTDQLQGGDATINANVALLGNVTVPCIANDPRPVGETLTAN